MSNRRRVPSLKAIFADFLVGFCSAELLDTYLPGSDAVADWIPLEDTPLEDLEEEDDRHQFGPIDSALCDPVPDTYRKYASRDYIHSVRGLIEVYGFTEAGVSRIAGINKERLREWFSETGELPDAEKRVAAMLAATYVYLFQLYQGEKSKSLAIWLITRIQGLGGRAPIEALLDGHLLAVTNLLARLAPAKRWSDDPQEKG